MYETIRLQSNLKKIVFPHDTYEDADAGKLDLPKKKKAEIVTETVETTTTSILKNNSSTKNTEEVVKAQPLIKKKTTKTVPTSRTSQDMDDLTLDQALALAQQHKEQEPDPNQA